MLPPEPRLPGARELVEEGQYFIVHAPRQTGKTTTLTALARDVTAEGQQVALLFSCERARIYLEREDTGAVGRAILQAITDAAKNNDLPAELMPPISWPDAPPESLLLAGLQAWARACPRPLVLFFDEIDSLTGPPLLSVLSQLRDGYQFRPGNFPASVALCGLRDIRDYRIAVGRDPERRSTSSPFNVKVESLRMGDFTKDQVAELYAQRTAETGQEFTPEAVNRAFAYSQGQPWLVNSLAREVIVKMGVKPPETITAAHIDEAKERLILARETHLDYLADRLSEPRVQRVIEPVLAGGLPPTRDSIYDDDVAYVRDLGLIAASSPIKIANPIYKEVIVRVLSLGIREVIDVDPHDYLLPDGRLDFGMVLTRFARFWRTFGEMLAQGGDYHETAPQLVFLAYLQSVVNGSGFVDCEYGLGSGRIDVYVRKFYTDADGKKAVQREAVELKVRRQGRGNPLKGGLDQLDDYLSQLDIETGSLIVFDRRPNARRKRPDLEFSTARTPDGREVTVLVLSA